MSDSNKGNPDRKIRSDKGSSIGRPMGDSAIGQNPESHSRPPKPPHNPHK